MTEIAHHAENAKRIGLTTMQRAEKRRRIAEISWEIAQLRDKLPPIEAALENDPFMTRRQIADKKLEIAEISWNSAQLRHESGLLKDDLATDKENFPR